MTVTKIIQITDTHIVGAGECAYGVVDTAAYLEKAVRQINALSDVTGPIDAVLVTGDLTDFGKREEYARFRDLMQPLQVPYCVLPGNHDLREPMREAFTDHDYMAASGPLNFHKVLGDLNILGLDSLVEGSSHGVLGDDTNAWLDEKLEALSDQAVIVALHHPSFATGIAHMDRQRLHDEEAFRARVGVHKGPRLVLCGHVHRHITAFTQAGAVTIAPSVAHAVTLDHRADAPATFTMEPGGFLIHTLEGAGPNAVFSSEFVPVGPFEGPYSFFEEDAA